MTYDGSIYGALAYLRPGQFPEFHGEEAWFEVRWTNKTMREFLLQVSPR